MANDLKLEIYKLKLSNKEDGTYTSYRKLFNKKFKNYGNNGSKSDKEITMEHIFNTFHADFIKKIDLKTYKTNEKKKKGFTIAYDDLPGGKTKTHISHSSTNFIISGILDGGKHGRNRSLSQVDDKTKKTPIGTKNIVTDRFYFLIYTPLDHSEAILMVQGYSEIKISDVFRDYLIKYFKFEKELVSKVEPFVPKSLKDKYLNAAVFKSMKFTDDWSIRPDFEGALTQKDYEIEVKIEIIDKSDKKIPYKKFREMINTFGKSIFRLEGSKDKKLLEFDDKKATMESKKRTKSINFNNEDEVFPTILLEDEGIKINDGGVPDFDQINLYCRELLKEITEEVMPIHAVENL